MTAASSNTAVMSDACLQAADAPAMNFLMPAATLRTLEALQGFLAALDGAGRSAFDLLGIMAGILYVLVTELAFHRGLHLS
jgi:hypothetical protein